MKVIFEKQSFLYGAREFITSQNQRSEIKTHQKPLMCCFFLNDFTHFFVVFIEIDDIYNRNVVSIFSFLF